jgi:Xaa-Pro aminopeptidase
MRVADIDARAREMLGEYAPHFTHSLGHGIGIDIHERPFISARSDDILASGMVITIEPGIYFTPSENRSERDIFGARYEEMFLVTDTGLILL